MIYITENIRRAKWTIGNLKVLENHYDECLSGKSENYNSHTYAYHLVKVRSEIQYNLNLIEHLEKLLIFE